MTPGQTRVLVLLAVLVAVEVFFHPEIRQSLTKTLTVKPASTSN